MMTTIMTMMMMMVMMMMVEVVVNMKLIKASTSATPTCLGCLVLLRSWSKGLQRSRDN